MLFNVCYSTSADTSPLRWEMSNMYVPVFPDAGSMNVAEHSGSEMETLEVKNGMQTRKVLNILQTINFEILSGLPARIQQKSPQTSNGHPGLYVEEKW